MQTVRILTASGIGEFGRYLARLRRNGSLPPPVALLTDAVHSAPCVLGNIAVEPRSFASRREFAEYIDGRFVEGGVTADADEDGMWEWLSLYYFDAVCPASRAGVRKPGADGRHLLENPDARRRHRHLLRGPYMLLRRYSGGPNGELDLLLSYALPVHGIAATHLGERMRVMASPGALIAASRLYGHPKAGGPRRGYSNDENGLRAYCRFLNNLPDCFELSSLSADTIIALLPEHFSAWLNNGEVGQEPSLQPFDGMRKIGALPDSQSVARHLNDLLEKLGTRGTTERRMKIRSDMFRTAVLGAYDSRCAISGLGIAHTQGMETGCHFEVEAAHIIPVSRGGRDVVYNGLALNRTIHWAFDHGMLWIDDDLRVGLAEEVDTNPRNHWLRQFRGRRLRKPACAQHRPNREALRWHALNVARSA
ncbi:MAG: HNH endonuclease [Gammaproteobacteria bacterium]|nr:HNH endonuclease [Gammaproteobacteria bacterium]MXW44769.1 hypothetical protein [Gammaproteobacteria bacterium]MYD01027.1 hypothetical protein [Gammaproteobacteria bacterium]MYI23965.1 hypothetical protein [Gammaproteobacteria bacterium]